MEQKAISSDLIRGHIDTIILHSLLSGDKFAQQISDSIEEKSCKEYKINQATLYSSLKRLESLKYVSSYWYDSVGGRRKYFKLTEAGKNTVNNNMESWSYSRTIIDKLIDCEQSYQPKVIEKIIEVPVIKEVQVLRDAPQNQPVPTQINATTKSCGNQSSITQNSPATEKVQEPSQELNFRNALNSLIKSSVIPKPNVQELQPINKEKTTTESHNNKCDEKLNFNETITSIDYNNQKVIGNTGKIDFGDLIIKSTKEGYKIKISSKDSGVAPGKFLINKLNLFAALAIYMISLLEFLLLTSLYGSKLSLPVGAVIGTIAIFTVFPLIRLVMFLKYPNQKSPTGVGPDKVLTSSIIVFNLLIITLAINLLCNVNFSDIATILLTFVAPCILYVDVLLYYIIKYIIGKMQTVKIIKKTA